MNDIPLSTTTVDRSSPWCGDVRSFDWPCNQWIIVSLFALLLSICTPLSAESTGWDIRLLAVDANVGIDIADLNNDGKLDVIAGRNWYPAPDFVPHPVRTIEDWDGYVESNCDLVYDVNGDGLTDVISFSWLPTEVYWYQNPGTDALKLGKMWPKYLLQDTESSSNECVLMHDLDGDGIPELVVNSWAKRQPLLAWKFSTEARVVKEKRGNQFITVRKEVPALKRITIGTDNNGHGLGFGDINGDGREDILFEAGWYERPESNAMTTPWTYHDDWFVHAGVPMLCRDLNKDGKMDIIVGRGHEYGLYWWEQLDPKDGKTQWKEHLIDASFSQSHALHWADLDGDGEGELITGKCFRAHNGRDPGGNEPPCLYSYTWDPARLKFTRHTIDKGRVGTGRQIRTADLNDDGRLDIAVAGKSGTYILFNKGTQRELLNKTPVMKTTAVPAFELTEEWKAKIEAIAPERPLAEPKKKRLALVFNLITGYDHWCTPHMSEVAKIMGKKSGAYDVVVSDDIAQFEKANIWKFDAIVLINNCSKNPGRNLFYDKLGDMEKANELEANLIDHVAKGNGLVGFHGAILMQNKSEAFSETMGGSFHYHPRQTTVVGKVLEKDHPISSAFKGEDLVHIDEPYRFNGAYSKFNFHPLLEMELPDFTPEEQAKLFRRSENNIARYLSWIKPHGAGRVFYCSPSHNAQSFENPKLLQFMLNGIQYALGDLECDDSVLGQ